jgi:hypothetical protein
MPAGYEFDRFLRYDELVGWLDALAAAHPALVSIETYGRSYEGRDLKLVTVTDAEHRRPRHQAGALGRRLDPRRGADRHRRRLLAAAAPRRRPRRRRPGRDGSTADAPFYVVRASTPTAPSGRWPSRLAVRRSSVRPWPWSDAHRWPGAHVEDVDGDGRILQMRIPDPNGAWTPHPEDARLMIPVPLDGAVDRALPLLDEGPIVDFDGFTIPTPAPPEGLDMNRNFPPGGAPASAARATTRCPSRRSTPSCGPSSPARTSAATTPSTPPAACCCGRRRRPPIRACRPSTCGCGRSSARSGTELTGYAVHSVFEDFTWDKSVTMSGAADDWAYEHLGVYSWTTEFWDAVKRATGEPVGRDLWYLGPTDAQALAVLRWCDEHAPDQFVAWYPFDHPQLGPDRARRLAPHRHLDQPAARPAPRGGHAARPLRRRPGAGVAAPGGRARHGRRPRRRHLAGGGRDRQHRGGCRPTSRRAAPRRR